MWWMFNENPRSPGSVLGGEITPGLEAVKASCEGRWHSTDRSRWRKCLVCGVEAESENTFHLVIGRPSMDTVGEFMVYEDFTKARQSVGVLVETTQITVLKQ